MRRGTSTSLTSPDIYANSYCAKDRWLKKYTHSINRIQAWRTSKAPPASSIGDSARIPSPSSPFLLFAYVCAPSSSSRQLDTDISPASLLVYLLGLIFTENYVLVFIVTILLLAADFYYLKNIAGRRLVGLRWWNEVNVSTGDSHWVFESAPQANEPGGKLVNATDKRFFWLALYAQPGLWVALAIAAIVSIKLIWLTLVGEYTSILGKVVKKTRLTFFSHCIGLDHYQHLGLFKMRQVQPGQRIGGERAVLWITRQERGRCSGFKTLESVARTTRLLNDCITFPES